MHNFSKQMIMYGWLLIVVMFGVSFFACTAMMGKQAPAANLVVAPVIGQPGSPISIYGTGFIPGEKVEIIMVVEGIPVELGAEPMIKEANEMGAFKAKSNIPRNAKPGVYAIKAMGDKGTIAVAPLEVEKKEKK